MIEEETTGIEEDEGFGGVTCDGEGVDVAREIEVEDVELPMSWVEMVGLLDVVALG